MCVNRPIYAQLLTLDFAKHGQNVLFRGPSGVGKTTLAQNFGQRALEKGMTVRFSTVNAAPADLLKQESLPAVERRMRRYTTPDLLCLDELGYLPCDARSGDLLYSIISRRHERASTVITTNLPFKEWGTIFPGARASSLSSTALRSTATSFTSTATPGANDQTTTTIHRRRRGGANPPRRERAGGDEPRQAPRTPRRRLAPPAGARRDLTDGRSGPTYASSVLLRPAPISPDLRAR